MTEEPEFTALVRVGARVLLLPSLVVAVAELVKGTSSAGGGFGAGVLAATGVLLVHLAEGPRVAERLVSHRVGAWIAIVGLLLALSVVFVPVLLGAPLLTHAPVHGAPVVHLGKLEVHTSLLFDLGIALVVFGFATTLFDLIARALSGSVS